ncbi:MAG: hypothetical protein JXC36_02685, partial [Candidatus Atribacteria bacterium]|nr:hypothetical protein [Candidatus Atribacteria bacterium]
SEVIERQLRLRIPGYHRMVYTSENQWMHPEKGLLGGKVIKIELENDSIQLKDYFEREWKIDISQATVRSTMPLAENMEIRIIGKKISTDIFKANEIRVMMRRFNQGGGRRPWDR